MILYWNMFWLKFKLVFLFFWGVTELKLYKFIWMTKRERHRIQNTSPSHQQKCLLLRFIECWHICLVFLFVKMKKKLLGMESVKNGENELREVSFVYFFSFKLKLIYEIFQMNVKLMSHKFNLKIVVFHSLFLQKNTCLP